METTLVSRIAGARPEPVSMSVLETRYGTWSGVGRIYLGPHGEVESLFLNEENLIPLSCGVVTPLYFVQDMGRRRETLVQFYPGGGLRSLPLQDRTWVSTSAGSFPAELLTFYKTGELRRVFPSAGKLSGFWTEENEYAEAPACDFNIGSYKVHAKLISIQFYKSGAIQSLTLWPEERITLQTPLGSMGIRTGVAFYPNGRIKSLEPASPTLVPTPIGMVAAFNNDPLGIIADVNSLAFDLQGQVESLLTVTSAVKVFPCDDEAALYAPARLQSFCEETDLTWRALAIRFTSGKASFGTGESAVSYPLESTQFEVVPHKAYVKASCGCG